MVVGLAVGVVGILVKQNGEIVSGPAMPEPRLTPKLWLFEENIQG